VANFYRIDPDGAIRQLCFDQEHNWCPTVREDGRVMYLRWDVRHGRRESDGAVQRIPGHGRKVESATDPRYQSTLIVDNLVDRSWPKFLHPYPLSDVKLDVEAWDRLVTWIDLNAPYHGTWTEIAGADRVKHLSQRRRELLKRYANVHSDPESEANPGARPKIDPVMPEPARGRRPGRRR